MNRSDLPTRNDPLTSDVPTSDVPTSDDHRADEPPMPVGSLLSVLEVAATLGVGERYVRRLIAERRLTHFKLGGKVRFAPEDVQSFLADQRRVAVTTTVIRSWS